MNSGEADIQMKGGYDQAFYHHKTGSLCICPCKVGFNVLYVACLSLYYKVHTAFLCVGLTSPFQLRY